MNTEWTVGSNGNLFKDAGGFRYCIASIRPLGPNDRGASPGFTVQRNGVEIAGPTCVGSPAGFKSMEAAKNWAEEQMTAQGGEVVMTRKEAEAFMKAIDASRKSATFQIDAIQRKRTWSPAERAMACVPYMETNEALVKLRALIGTRFNLGGH
jgi:hypothetical protein